MARPDLDPTLAPLPDPPDSGATHLGEPTEGEEAAVISAEDPDWSRETPQRLWDPPKRLLRSIRRYQHWHRRGGFLPGLWRRRWVLSHRFWSVVTGADIPLNCQLGGGLVLKHPNGVVIHPDAAVGPNCLILQQVTLGGAPVLGGHVDVGAGAKILGSVRVGDHAVIGANAVVLDDVPAGKTAVGVPAKVID